MGRVDARRLTLLAATLGSAVVFLDGTVVNVALPAIREDLDAGLESQQWIVEAYLLTLGALLLVGGSLGDLFGRRRVFSLGLLGFGLTSLVCAVAPSSEVLIAGRALQGLAGAALVPASLALITANFPESERGAAIGAWTAWTGISFVIGPLGGGALIEFVSWRWIFAINLPLAAVTLWLAQRVPETREEGEDRRVDWTGAALCALGLGGPVFALIEQPRYGWADPLVWAPGLAGLALLALFVVWEGRTSHPMLPLGLFRERNFAVGNLATLAIYGGLGVATFLLTIFLQQVAGYSAIAAGVALMPITACMWVLSRRFGALAGRFGPRLFMGLGPVVAGLGMIWMSRLDASVSYPGDLLPGILLFGIGLSATVAPLTTTVLAAAGEHHAGAASGVNNAIARVASLLAIAVVGLVVSARYEAAGGTGEPLSAGSPAAVSASVSAYRSGVGLAGGLVVLGGLLSLAGIVNPRRREEPVPPRLPDLAAPPCPAHAAACRRDAQPALTAGAER